MLALALLLVAQTPDVPSAGAGFSLDAYGSEQVLVVATRSWTDVAAVLTRYEKVGGKWMQLGAPVEVVVGEGGLGWGLGLHPLGVGEPRKTEGDGRAPAGVFALSSAFGPGAPASATKMPWLKATDTLVCVDDPRAEAYNHLVDEAQRAPDAGPPSWKTAERMRRKDALYDLGVIVDHNGLGDAHAQVIPGRGSCVFLHVWRRKGRGTAGCTAMARWDLEKIVEWLDPDKKPVLVQMPREELVKRRIPWALP